MSEITILKRDMNIFNDLTSGRPYKVWCAENEYEDSIHTKAQYILEMNINHTWNKGFSHWVDSNVGWLNKVSKGYSLRIIMHTISVVRFNDSDVSKPILSSEPLSYESGDDD